MDQTLQGIFQYKVMSFCAQRRNVGWPQEQLIDCYQLNGYAQMALI